MMRNGWYSTILRIQSMLFMNRFDNNFISVRAIVSTLRLPSSLSLFCSRAGTYHCAECILAFTVINTLFIWRRCSALDFQQICSFSAPPALWLLFESFFRGERIWRTCTRNAIMKVLCHATHEKSIFLHRTMQNTKALKKICSKFNT